MTGSKAAKFLPAIARRWARARGGAVTPMYALAFIPIVLMVGAGVDYGSALNLKAKLDAAADAAALAAISASTGGTPAQAQAQAVSVFNGQAGALKAATVSSLTITVQDNAGVRTAVVNYAATMQTAVMGLANRPVMTMKGSATAAQNNPIYMDFYVLLDNTPSMGLGATQADIDKLVAVTGCAFACHDLSGQEDYYTVAKQNGVTMRIDVVRQATQSLMDTATTTAAVPNQFHMAVGTFGTACPGPGQTQQLQLLTGLTDPASAKNAAAGVDLMTIPQQGYNNDQCTDFNAAMSQANGYIPSPGDGATSAAPQKILFFVSDGVNDSYDTSACTQPSSGGRCMEPINTAYCTAIKNRGIQIAVLYTTYLPLPTNSFWQTWISPFSNTRGLGNIGPNMQNCASPNLYFEVSPTLGISTAMNALFNKVVRQARLTQ